MKKGLLIGIIGMFLILYSLISSMVYSKVFWYGTFVLGGTLFLGYINCNLKIKSLFYFNKKTILKQYLIYFICGLIIEMIGRFTLHLWIDNPSFTFIVEIVEVFLLAYPFAFFFIYESFMLIKKIVKSFGLAVFLTTLISAFLHEYPNTFVWEWTYRIPYISFEILQINIVVIFGWMILVAIPLIVNNKIIKNI